jgi:hypothetical protein
MSLGRVELAGAFEKLGLLEIRGRKVALSGQTETNL